MHPTAALAGLLLATFGPIDVDERDLTSPVSAMLVLSNRSAVPVEVAFELEPSDWTTRAGKSSGRERLRPGQEIVLPVRGSLGDPLYPLPAARTQWEGEGKRLALQSVASVRKLAEARLTKETVNANGVLSEDCWLLGRRFAHFGTELGERPVASSPEWMVAHSAKGVHFGVLCHEPDIRNVVATERDRDDPALAQDESVEIFLDCLGTRSEYYHLVLNAAGALLDERCISKGSQIDRSWDARAEFAVQQGRERYYVELTIPLDSLGVTPPQPGTVWLINVARNQRLEGMAAPVRTLWNANPGGYHNVEAFGAVVFK